MAARLTAAEARRQAEADGLTLQRSESNAAGFQNVTIDRSSKAKPYVAKVWRGGKQVYLGMFATAEEAALAVARTPEGKVAAAGAAAAPAPLTAAEARRQAEADGLTLLRSESNASGFQGVRVRSGSKVKPYQAQVWRGDKMVHLGHFATAEEASLVFARTPEGKVAAAGAAAAQAPLTAAEARRQAEAEGLTLLSSETNATGFKGVSISSRCRTKPYQVQVRRGDKNVHLGRFVTAEEAALAFARTPEGRAAATAAAATPVPSPCSSSVAKPPGRAAVHAPAAEPDEDDAPKGVEEGEVAAAVAKEEDMEEEEEDEVEVEVVEVLDGPDAAPLEPLTVATAAAAPPRGEKRAREAGGVEHAAKTRLVLTPLAADGRCAVELPLRSGRRAAGWKVSSAAPWPPGAVQPDRQLAAVGSRRVSLSTVSGSHAGGASWVGRTAAADAPFRNARHAVLGRAHGVADPRVSRRAALLSAPAEPPGAPSVRAVGSTPLQIVARAAGGGGRRTTLLQPTGAWRRRVHTRRLDQSTWTLADGDELRLVADSARLAEGARPKQRRCWAARAGDLCAYSVSIV